MYYEYSISQYYLARAKARSARIRIIWMSLVVTAITHKE
jgi:hypothetical protein